MCISECVTKINSLFSECKYHTIFHLKINKEFSEVKINSSGICCCVPVPFFIVFHLCIFHSLYTCPRHIQTPSFLINLVQLSVKDRSVRRRLFPILVVPRVAGSQPVTALGNWKYLEARMATFVLSCLYLALMKRKGAECFQLRGLTG